MAGCNPRKCSIDFEPDRDTGCLFPSDPDCKWSCWCFSSCSVRDAAESEGLGCGVADATAARDLSVTQGRVLGDHLLG